MLIIHRTTNRITSQSQVRSRKYYQSYGWRHILVFLRYLDASTVNYWQSPILKLTVQTLNSCTNYLGSPVIFRQPHARLSPFPWYSCMCEVTTERTLICKLCWSLMCLDYFFDISNMGVCTTSHRQTSGQLVQEIHVCTAYR